MKQNKMMRIASVLLVAFLLSTCVISGTFAKFTAKKTGTASATVAKWEFDFKGDGEDGTETNTFNFNLGNTITATTGEDEAGSADNDVATGVIAPGTQGSFKIILENKSEVTANYKTTFVDDGLNNAQLTFTYTVQSGTSEAQSVSAQDLANGYNIAIGEEVTITVNWVWAFGENNVEDTTFAGTTLSRSITINVTQVN